MKLLLLILGIIILTYLIVYGMLLVMGVCFFGRVKKDLKDGRYEL